MSSKSSLRSARSMTSSAGETHVSSHSSGSSNRHRRGRVAAYAEPRLPPAVMSASERLDLVRCSVTRLQYVCERQLHMQALDQAGGPAVDAFFDKLRRKLEAMQHPSSSRIVVDTSNSRSDVPPVLAAPTQLQHMAQTVGKLRDAAEQMKQAVVASQTREGGAVAVYARLKEHLLQEAVTELAELHQLLTHRPREMPTRVDTTLLADLVAFHVDDFDTFAAQRVPHFLQEAKDEGAFYAGAVMTDASQRASPLGIASVVVLDVAIGVRPGRCARIVLEHARQRLTKVDNRLQSADAVLHEADGAPADQGEDATRRLTYELQRREYSVMKERMRQALSELDALAQRWEAEELAIFDRATAGNHDLDTVWQTKQLKEAEVVEEAQAIHDRALHVCLPFASPQYHRRYAETYSQPCHIRIGFHFIAEDAGGGGTADAMRTTGTGETKQAETAGRGTASLVVYTAMPGFLPWMRQRRVPASDYERYAYLVPSKEQFWLSFSDFPEMVKGARCVLRDVHHRLDHFRAMEETKEVGGYFIMRGGERILRALLMQRCNVPVNIQRERFQTQGPHFSSKAVVIRCKRPSGLTVQNYFYYTTLGDAVFSFARKVVWHIPVTLLLFATSTRNVTGLELYKLLTVGMPAGNHAARVEATLQHHQERPYSALCHYVDYLTVLGRMYREYHEQSNTFHFLPQYVTGLRCQHDAWYGLFMLRRHVLPHLNRAVATPDLSPTATSAQLADWLPPALREELDRKFDVLLAILRQLYLFVDGAVQHQGNDVPAYQEIFTVSQVLVGAFEVCLNKYLRGFAYRFGRHLPAALFRNVQALPLVASRDAEDTMRQLRELSEYCARRSGGDPLDLLHRLLTTGNLSLDREEDFYCPQTSGWVVMAEHLNFYRFFEQLRCVHRGKTIAEMRSSEVRKYPCEAYGYICMVHSPDGEDCGVLNHLSVSTIMSSSMPAQSEQRTQLLAWLRELLPDLHVFRTAAYAVPAGSSSTTSTSTVEELLCSVPVWVEGELYGYVAPAMAARAAVGLRERKALVEQALVTVHGIVRRHDVSSLHTIEVVYVAPANKDPAGLYIFYDCGRLMRPVQQIETTASDRQRLGSAVSSTASQLLPFPLVYIGTWEQTWLDVASVPSDLLDGVVQLNRKYQYMEQNGSNLISLTATTIPFFEYNCSPRNLFQCGLSKQSAGTQLQALAWRKEAKLFRMYTPQRYISRTLSMDAYNLDEVNLGVNAVVAILAYTGYDMDDAVILNHTAAQRGMLTAGVTVAKVITAGGHGEKDDVFVFHNLLSTGERFSAELGRDGLPLRRANPQLGGFSFDTDHKYPALQTNSDVYCCAKRVERVDLITNQKVYEYTRHHTTKWRHFDKGENAWVHSVVPLAYNGPDPTTVLVVFRIPRPPNVGDKFSSRHGQKGTLPLHIRATDLPFASASGIVPDVIINPHAFPSRMTVGMVLEIMAGKVGAVEGRFMDNSAWSTVDATPRVAEVIGQALLRSGYNRYGRECLIDGVSGETMEAEVFMGISGYQRLRHMVSDKWQARARTDAHTFRAVTKTGQPVKGRKRHGGVRVGEMERDGLLSHGISEVVLDRLLHVSDKTKAFICPECGGLLSIYERHATEYSTWKTCRFCGAGTEESSDTIAMVEIPQVLRLWAAELTSIGIRVALQTDEVTPLMQTC